jgi:hypothetical protein
MRVGGEVGLWFFKKRCGEFSKFFEVLKSPIFFSRWEISKPSHSNDTDIKCNPFKHSWELRVWIRINFCLFSHLLLSLLVASNDATCCWWCRLMLYFKLNAKIIWERNLSHFFFANVFFVRVYKDEFLWELKFNARD